jgi:hypothetical protein
MLFSGVHGVFVGSCVEECVHSQMYAAAVCVMCAHVRCPLFFGAVAGTGSSVCLDEGGVDRRPAVCCCAAMPQQHAVSCWVRHSGGLWPLVWCAVEVPVVKPANGRYNSYDHLQSAQGGEMLPFI